MVVPVPLGPPFPELSHLLGDPNDAEPGQPYHAYGLFAAEVLRRRSDTALLDRTASFINEVTASNEHILKEMAGVELLETSAQVPGIAQALYSKLTPRTQDDLRAIERGCYGRSVE
jgi:hypothetical protein